MQCGTSIVIARALNLVLTPTSTTSQDQATAQTSGSLHHKTNTTARVSPPRDAAAHALQYHTADSCTQPQVRYAYYDYNMRLKYESGVVLDPAWLSLLPKVSSQGSSWLYAKAKRLSGVLRATHHSCSLSSATSCCKLADIHRNFNCTKASAELH